MITCKLRTASMHICEINNSESSTGTLINSSVTSKLTKMELIVLNVSKQLFNNGCWFSNERFHIVGYSVLLKMGAQQTVLKNLCNLGWLDSEGEKASLFAFRNMGLFDNAPFLYLGDSSGNFLYDSGYTKIKILLLPFVVFIATLLFICLP